jgi:hypothetical protein
VATLRFITARRLLDRCLMVIESFRTASESVTVTDAGHLLLTGALRGTATPRAGAKTRVRRQPFTALAVPVDAERTTDVVLLKMAPIALASVGRQLTLAPVPLDIEAVPDESLLFPTLLN